MSHVPCGSPSASHAGKIARRNTLFDEMGLPTRVEKTSASGSAFSAWSFHLMINCSAVPESGICRTPAAVFGVPNTPS